MPTVTEKELVREFAEIHGIRADSLEWLESTILNDSLAFDEFVKSKEKQNREYANLLTDILEIARKEQEEKAKKDLEEWIEFSKQFMK